jgi:hypothetical protein
MKNNQIAALMAFAMAMSAPVAVFASGKAEKIAGGKAGARSHR